MGRTVYKFAICYKYLTVCLSGKQPEENVSNDHKMMLPASCYCSGNYTNTASPTTKTARGLLRNILRKIKNQAKTVCGCFDVSAEAVQG